MKKGKLSFEESHGGQRLLDASELTRFFGNDLDFGKAEPSAKRPAFTKESNLAKVDSVAHVELTGVQKQLDREISERNHERERLEKQVDELHSILERTQEGHQKAMLLLENRSERSADWEKPLEALKSQVANQQKEQQELRENAKRTIGRLRKELEQEKSKSFLERLFG